jgi:hypothetical protein
MTPDGLKKTNDLDADELKKGNFRMRINKDGVEINIDETPNSPALPPPPGKEDNYRYNNDRSKDTSVKDIKIKLNEKKGNLEIKASNTGNKEELPSYSGSSFNPASLFVKMFQL